jgi:hypothetical protein
LIKTESVGQKQSIGIEGEPAIRRYWAMRVVSTIGALRHLLPDTTPATGKPRLNPERSINR